VFTPLQPARTQHPKSRAQRIGVRLAVIVLLFAVAGFATLAKNSLYYPKSGNVQYISIASKMKVSQPAQAAERPLSLPAGTMVLPQPDVQPTRAILEEPAAHSLAGFTRSPQDRAPPVSPA